MVSIPTAHGDKTASAFQWSLLRPQETPDWRPHQRRHRLSEKVQSNMLPLQQERRQSHRLPDTKAGTCSEWHTPHGVFWQRPQRVKNKRAQEKPNCNPKFVCQICGYTGHSALKCRHRNTNTNTDRSIPYQRQNPDENRSFRKDFKQANKRQFPANQTEEAHSDSSNSGDEADQSGSLN